MSKKLIALVLAVTFAFSFVAKGATVEELQAQIAALLAQIQALQAQLGQQTTTTGACFTTDLKLGMKNDDVKNLQIKLGVTPATGYFGPLTLAAVKKFQAENGIPTTGYVGPLTRTALNSKFCAPPVTVPPTTAPTTPTTSVAPSYGTLSVQDYPLSNPVTTLYGGQTYEVLAGQFKATGSDITLKKVAVELTTSSAFPWTYFSAISAWDGSTKLGEVAVSQANVIQNSFASDYTLNISGLNWIIPNGQQKVLTIKATVAPTIVNSKSFTFALPTNQVVFSDTAGVTYTSVTGSITNQTYTISNAQQATATITLATDNPLAGNIIGSTSGTTKADLLKFNVKVDNVNVTFNSGTITATSSDAKLVSVELWDGSTLVASAAPSATGSVMWSNFSLPISAGTTKTLTVKGVIAQLTTGYAGGSTIKVTDSPVLTGIDANSNAITTSGSVTGNQMKLFLVAPTFAYVSKSVSVRGTNSTTHPQDIGDTSLTFSVTANGGDIYIPEKTNTSITEGLYPTLTKPTNATSTTATTWTCSGPAVEDTSLGSGKYLWRIPSGSTANCTFSTLVTNTDSYSGYFNVALGGVKWYTSASATSSLFIDQNWGLTNINTGDFYLGN